MPTAADNFWAFFFGVPAEAFCAPGLHVVAHVGLDRYNGAWVFRHGMTTVVSVPDGMWEHVQRGLAAGMCPDFIVRAAWGRIFGRPITKVIGPAYDGFLGSELMIKSPLPARRLNTDDCATLAGLRAVCTDEEWDQGGINADSDEPMFGCVVGDRLAGVSQNEARTPRAVSPGVITAPDMRWRGIGAAVLAAAVRDALATGRVVVYQALMSNRASIRLGESLGVIAYAEHYAYRFTPGTR